MDYKLAIEYINSKQNFSFSRWGDGEWNCILQPNDNKGNCDKHKYFESLSKQLQDVLKSNPEYYLGMQNFAINQNGENINKWLFENNVNTQWQDADIFHKASIKGQFFSFFEALQNRDVILVGPKRIVSSTKLSIEGFIIEVQDQDCWLQKNNTVESIKNLIDLEDKKNFVVLICASMTANVIVDDLYNWSKENTYLDMGSVFEPYTGHSNRTYHKKLIDNLDIMKQEYLDSKK